MFENQSHCIFAPGELSSIISQNFVPVKVFFEKNPDPPSLDKKTALDFQAQSLTAFEWEFAQSLAQIDPFVNMSS